MVCILTADRQGFCFLFKSVYLICLYKILRGAYHKVWISEHYRSKTSICTSRNLHKSSKRGLLQSFHLQQHRFTELFIFFEGQAVNQILESSFKFNPVPMALVALGIHDALIGIISSDLY